MPPEVRSTCANDGKTKRPVGGNIAEIAHRQGMKPHPMGDDDKVAKSKRPNRQHCVNAQKTTQPYNLRLRGIKEKEDDERGNGYGREYRITKSEETTKKETDPNGSAHEQYFRLRASDAHVMRTNTTGNKKGDMEELTRKERKYPQ